MKLTAKRVSVLGEAYTEISDRIEQYIEFRYKDSCAIIDSFCICSVRVYTEYRDEYYSDKLEKQYYDIPYWVFEDDWKQRTLDELYDIAQVINDEVTKKKEEIVQRRIKLEQDKVAKELELLAELKKKYE